MLAPSSTRGRDRERCTYLLTCGAETHVSQRCSKKHFSPLGFMKAMLDCQRKEKKNVNKRLECVAVILVFGSLSLLCKSRLRVWQQKVFQGMVSSKFISQSLREFRLQAPSGPQSQAKRELLANNVLRNLSTNLPKNQCFRMSESSQVKWIPDNDQTTE